MTDDPVRTETELESEREAPAASQPSQREIKKSVSPPMPKPEAAPAAPSWLVHRIKSISLRYKIAGTLIIILSLAVASLGVVTFARQNAILRNEMKSRAATLAHQLANAGKEGLLTKQEMPVFSTITDILNRDDMVYAMVLDTGGRVFAHSDLSKKGSVPGEASDRAALKAPSPNSTG